MKTNLATIEGNQVAVVTREDDLDPFLDRNKMLQTMEQDRKSDLRHHASIPNIILTRWLNEEWNKGNHGLRFLSEEFNQLIDRKLQDPEWAYLRVDGPSHRVGYGS